MLILFLKFFTMYPENGKENEDAYMIEVIYYAVNTNKLKVCVHI